jgi:aldose 1-epimerase
MKCVEHDNNLIPEKNMYHLFGSLAVWAAVLGSVLFAGCAALAAPGGQVSPKAPFGNANGVPVDIYTLSNANGMEARICTFGAALVSLTAPDRDGKFADVVLGFDKVEDYIKYPSFLGVLVGRYGNRIAKGKFVLNGVTYTLAANNNGNALHGGIKGFDKVVWRAMPIASSAGPGLELTYVSKDGEEGYPGTLVVNAVYTLTRDNALHVDITAKSDKDTVVNLTGHSYFNLAGKGDVLGHEVYINADKFIPVDSTLIPTGELKDVSGTPFDFRKPTTIGARINQPDEQLKFGAGYDQCMVINKQPGKLEVMARVTEPTTGRVLEVSSTEPGLQFYSGNHLDGQAIGKGGARYEARGGFCMEPGHFPDSPNHPNFPSATLKAGDTYKHTIVYKFSAK